MGPALKLLRAYGWAVFAACLGAMALWNPATLYLVALSVFGLPHVLWEMAWVRRVWGPTLPRLFWGGLLAALALQACSRVALWRDRIDASTAALCDAGTLALALMTALTLFRGAKPGQRGWLLVLAVSVPALLIGIADTPEVMAVLAVLAIAHNFTPIGLVPAGARIGRWPARAVLVCLFAAPLLLFVLLWMGGDSVYRPSSWQPTELGWAESVSPRLASALLPALVWAQCLHYLAVLHLLPKAVGTAWQGMPWRPLALAGCLLLLAGFVTDFTVARGLYAVAAGAHAWIEWPLVLIAGLGLARPVLHSARA